MRDYLNTGERQDIVALDRLCCSGRRLIGGTALTKDESANLKRAVTYTNKVFKSMSERLNEYTNKSLTKDILRSTVYIDVYGKGDSYITRAKAKLDAEYEENADYFKLVELILHHQCRNCTKNGSECGFFAEFEAKNVPEFDGREPTGNCRYCYKG